MNCRFQANIRKRSSCDRKLTLDKDLVSLKQRKTKTNQGILFGIENRMGTTEQNLNDVNQEYKTQKYYQGQKERGQIILQTLTSPSSPISERSIGCVSPIINHFYDNNQDTNEDENDYIYNASTKQEKEEKHIPKEDQDEDEDLDQVLSLEFLASLLKDENEDNDPILKYNNKPKEDEETNSNTDYDSVFDDFDYSSDYESDSKSDYDSNSDSGDEKTSKFEQDQEEIAKIHKLESELEEISSGINELNYKTNESKNENLRLNKELEELLYYLTNQDEHPSTFLKCSHHQQLIGMNIRHNVFKQKIEDKLNQNENTNLFIKMSRNI
ncbi:hypothetical protein M0813_16033 [Anaeramoeba flamelloides]|uniref:Uncharacterized protein n=1 Tax=Anaeramoeba flamelloides TaxID=1746091 RepID=A0ABQ8Z106_9EUKA|nr:hypothetical protein M0813_16033 [Anaeramoeba flamelloides]